MSCAQELCPSWSGDGRVCPCALLGIPEPEEWSMACPRCGLPDSYRGQGDGIGSCDCSRCACCGAAPDDCECSREVDEMYDDPDEPWDVLCNDSSCVHLLHRLESKRLAGASAGAERGAEGDPSKDLQAAAEEK